MKSPDTNPEREKVSRLEKKVKVLEGAVCRIKRDKLCASPIRRVFSIADECSC